MDGPVLIIPGRLSGYCNAVTPSCIGKEQPLVNFLGPRDHLDVPVYNFLVDLIATPQESRSGHSNRCQHVAVFQALKLCRHTPRDYRDAVDQLELSLRYARYPCRFTMQCSCDITNRDWIENLGFAVQAVG